MQVGISTPPLKEATPVPRSSGFLLVQGSFSLTKNRDFLSKEDQVHWYLEHGANPSFRSAGGNNDIPSFAGKTGTVATIRMLHAAGADFTKSNALHMAAGSSVTGRLEVMAYLLDELHVPVNQREYEFDQKLYNEWKGSGLHGGTALHAAIKERKTESAEFLVGRGIDAGVKDGKNRRAVDLARELSLEAMLRLLEPQP